MVETTPPKILLVEGYDAPGGLIPDTLNREGMLVTAAKDRAGTLHRYLDHETFDFDLLLLDADLTGIDSLDVCRRLRAKNGVPIIILGIHADEANVVAALEAGADDYVTKPCNMRELACRVKARLRRQRINNRPSSKLNGGSRQKLLEFPGLVIDLLRHRVLAQSDPVELTSAQFKILTLLASHPGRVYSREQIMEPIWGSEFYGGSRAPDVHIQNIRQKIEPDPTSPRYVQTVRGAGYRFAEVAGRKR